MRKKKGLITAVILAAAVMLSGCQKEISSADPSFPSSIKNTGSSEIMAEPYTESYASRHPELIASIEGYDANGVLVEEQENTQMSDIQLVLTTTESYVDGTHYAVSSDGVKTKTSSWEFSYQDGKVSKKQVLVYSDENALQENSESDMQSYTVEYTYTGDGNVSTETTKVTTESGSKKTKSVMTYFYTEDGICSGYTLFNMQDNILQETKYVNNTNGKPVKEKTYSSDGTCIQTVINSYNSDGTISQTEIKDSSGNTTERRNYIYDKNGYLIKSLLYQMEDEKLTPYRAYIFQY